MGEPSASATKNRAGDAAMAYKHHLPQIGGRRSDISPAEAF